MPDANLLRRTISELAETNPETLGARADPRASFKYVDLSAVSAGEVAWTSAPEVTLLTAPSRARRVLRQDDILFGTVRPNLQSHGYVDWPSGGHLIGSTGFSVIRARRGVADPRYLFHCIMSTGVLTQANRNAVGSSYPALNDSDVRGFNVFAPPLGEQASIAQILDTLDTTIRQTEAIIEKLKRVKQGLLHDLLTRGIDANGELRPPQSQAPHLYKDSPLGWIPKEWNVCGVLDLAPTNRQCILTGPFGAQLGQADFVVEGVPVLRIGNVQAGFIDWSDVQFVSHAKASRLERFSVEPGDLLFARQGATTGRNALADERADGALINYHIIRVAVDRERCEPVYLHALFNSDQSKGQVDQEKGRGTREGINSKQIAALRFAMPQIKEQQVLVARMNALGEAMARELNVVAKLRLAKSGLMDDLLTGRVRVTPLLAAARP